MLAIGLLLLALGVVAGIRFQQARQMREDYFSYKARAAALRWLRWRLFGVALGWWAVIVAVVAVLMNTGGESP